MVNSRFSISLVIRTGRVRLLAAWKSVDATRTRPPVQSNPCHMAVRNPATRGIQTTNSSVEGNFVELVAGKTMEVAAECPVHPYADKPITVCIRLHSAGTGLEAAVA